MCFTETVFVFCKMNMFLLSSLSNMINDSVSRWVGSRWIGGKVVGGQILIFLYWR